MAPAPVNNRHQLNHYQLSANRVVTTARGRAVVRGGMPKWILQTDISEETSSPT